MLTVFVVEDEKSTREGLLAYIPWRELGIENVHSAEDGIKGLELAKDMKPDIALLDVKMPRMNGIELARNLREMYPNCKLIFLSSYTDKEYLKSAISLQAVSYIEKPVDIDEVVSVLKEVVKKCNEEMNKVAIENQYKSKMNESIELIRQNFLLDLVHGNYHDLKTALGDFKEIINMNIKDDCFVSIILKLTCNTDDSILKTLDFKKNFQKQVSEIIKGFGVELILGFKDDYHLILLLYGYNVRNGFYTKKVCEDVLKKIKETYKEKLRIVIGIGKYVNEILNVLKSYNMAAVAVLKHFFRGYDIVVVYEEIPGNVYSFEDNMTKTMEQYLKNGNINEAIYWLRNIIMNLKKYENTLINNIKDYFFKLSMTLSKIADDLGVQINEKSQEDFVWEVLSKIDTLDQIEEYVLIKIQLFFKYKDDREKYSSTVFSVIKYITANYSKESLSIKDIALYTYLTPNYLCMIFKKETEKTINQYITEIRVEKAKEILKDKKTKLYQVALSVGYSDQNYFAKIFKKVVGLNPSEYRERYLI